MLVSIAALFAYVNYHYLKLPSSIGLMLLAMLNVAVSRTILNVASTVFLVNLVSWSVLGGVLTAK